LTVIEPKKYVRIQNNQFLSSFLPGLEGIDQPNGQHQQLSNRTQAALKE
jgi:hypothetical protein